MRRFLLSAMLILVAGHAPAQWTNPVSTGTVQISVQALTNGVLATPTNFWDANAADIRGAITNQPVDTRYFMATGGVVNGSVTAVTGTFTYIVGDGGGVTNLGSSALNTGAVTTVEILDGTVAPADLDRGYVETENGDTMEAPLVIDGLSNPAVDHLLIYYPTPKITLSNSTYGSTGHLRYLDGSDSGGILQLVNPDSGGGIQIQAVDGIIAIVGDTVQINGEDVVTEDATDVILGNRSTALTKYSKSKDEITETNTAGTVTSRFNTVIADELHGDGSNLSGINADATNAVGSVGDGSTNYSDQVAVVFSGATVSETNGTSTVTIAAGGASELDDLSDVSVTTTNDGYVLTQAADGSFSPEAAAGGGGVFTQDAATNIYAEGHNPEITNLNAAADFNVIMSHNTVGQGGLTGGFDDIRDYNVFFGSDLLIYSSSDALDGCTVSGGVDHELGFSSGGNYMTISGGFDNYAVNSYTTIGGGQGNSASKAHATVAGGQANVASGAWAFIGGGQDNTAGANHSTVPGGRNNEAGGIGSWAGGVWARAAQSGQYTWHDNSGAVSAWNGLDAAQSYNVFASGGALFDTDGTGMIVRTGSSGVFTIEDTDGGSTGLVVDAASEQVRGYDADGDLIAYYDHEIFSHAYGFGHVVPTLGSFNSILSGKENTVGNNASQTECVVAGGRQNQITGFNVASAILGGVGNTITGTTQGSSILGGQLCDITGALYSMVAGYDANSTHRGALVFNDGDGSANSIEQDGAVLSFDASIYLKTAKVVMDAAGTKLGIGTNAPAEALHVNGSVKVEGGVMSTVPTAGELYVGAGATNEYTIGTSFQTITNLSAGYMGNITPDASAGQMTNDNVGVFDVFVQMSVIGDTSVEWHAALFTNGVEDVQIGAYRKTANNDVGSYSFGGIVELPAGTPIDVRVKADGVSKNYDVLEMQFEVKRLN